MSEPMVPANFTGVGRSLPVGREPDDHVHIARQGSLLNADGIALAKIGYCETCYVTIWAFPL